MTTDEVAKLLGLTRAAMCQRRLRGNGPPYIKLGPRCIRYSLADVEAWLHAHRVESPKSGPRGKS